MKIIDSYKKINEFIDKCSNIYVTGHKNLDLDALGACIAMYNYALSKHKEAYFILDDKSSEAAVSKVIKQLSNSINFISSDKAKKLKNGDSGLIVLDTNKEYLLQSPSLSSSFDKKIVIDHHGIGDGTINDAYLTVLDLDSSSTCQMITEFLKINNFTIDSYLATILLAGIVLDTNNYVLKTDSNTFYYSYYLTTCGANTNHVQYILKQDLKKYIKRQKMITNVKVVNKMAITKAVENDIYRPEELAKAADTLLLFNDIVASFVVARVDKKTVGISARSLGDINVGQVLSLLHGGGDNHEAASKLENTTVSKVEKELLNIINLL